MVETSQATKEYIRKWREEHERRESNTVSRVAPEDKGLLCEVCLTPVDMGSRWQRRKVRENSSMCGFCYNVKPEVREILGTANLRFNPDFCARETLSEAVRVAQLVAGKSPLPDWLLELKQGHLAPIARTGLCVECGQIVEGATSGLHENWSLYGTCQSCRNKAREAKLQSELQAALDDPLNRKLRERWVIKDALKNDPLFAEKFKICEKHAKAALKKQAMLELGIEPMTRAEMILRATPENQTKADREAIAGIYHQAREMTIATGMLHHVDHIVPLSKGGLHEPSNLQVITAQENLSKGSKI